MPRAKKDSAAATEATAVETAEKKTAAKKTTAKKTAVKKAPTEKAAAEKTATARKPRAPRKKAVVPNFVIQNSAEDGVSYEDVVKKVQAAVTAETVTSLDIYVKAEEGKAYYVVNGEAAGAVDLF